jgi:site-specific recombinase XerD
MCSAQIAPSQYQKEERVLPSQPLREEKEIPCPLTPANGGTAQGASPLSERSRQRSSDSANHYHPHQNAFNKTLEPAIKDYLEDQKRHHRRPKTLEWHEQALGLFQRYLLAEHQCVSLSQITEEFVRGWFAALSQTPTATGALRSPGTVASYARSARAFCQWLVRYRYLPATPFADLPLPSVENGVPHPLEPEEWEHLLLACHAPKETGVIADLAAARNRAILWILFETDMHVTEVCQLRLEDVDREHATLRVQGTGSKARWLTLGHEGWSHLVAYLEEYRFKEEACFEQRGASSEPLFLSETGRPLTKSAVALVFNRLRKRAGVSRKNIRASLVRESFAVRYLRTGGDRQILLELLGQQKSAIIPCSVGEK